MKILDRPELAKSAQEMPNHINGAIDVVQDYGAHHKLSLAPLLQTGEILHENHVRPELLTAAITGRVQQKGLERPGRDTENLVHQKTLGSQATLYF